jgi:hypothetical protein
MKQRKRNFLFLLPNCLLGKLIDMTSISAIINKVVHFFTLGAGTGASGNRSSATSKRRLRLQDKAHPPLQEDAGWYWEVICSPPIRSPR